ncbi:MAG: hypothetical protein BHW64_01555 [Candidatus Melainabacteria bacterium LEY3_CP_29_8]|nr:MAG: hypothetical protein BHW64_01555 [Candidatus Melainabacteria bacterium LEY3_CP_29_8]
MGLSASSLRIAMLTARKSGLEFEGQTINQQRSTLANETSALFNKMLTMQVPTPPDPSEYTRMFYTFDAGGGLSQILNVARNASGAYTHDVTYKGPKTSSVLMKKPLNNVGFKYDSEKKQLSALIDGLQYGLEANGDKDRFNEYLTTKATYDNMKNVESAHEKLSTMSKDKVLTQVEARDYLEAIGLSSTEPPTKTTDDVQSFDDAFGNIYAENIQKNMVNIPFYNSSTLPSGVTNQSDKDFMLSCNPNSDYCLYMNQNDDGSYTMEYPKKTELGVSITKKDGYWQYSANNISAEELSSICGVDYSYILKYTIPNKDGENQQEVVTFSNDNFSIPEYTNGNLTISSCKYNGQTWSYTASVTGASNVTFKKDGSEETITSGGTYNPNDGIGEYNVSGTYPELKFTRTELISKPIQDPNNISEDSYSFNKGEQIDNRNVTYSINNSGLMTVSTSESAILFGYERTTNNMRFFKDIHYGKDGKRATASFDEGCIPANTSFYWYDVVNNNVACKYNDNGAWAIYNGQDAPDFPDLDAKWVKVQKDPNNGHWFYTYQLTDDDYNDKIVKSKTYNGNTYTLNDENKKYTRTDENGVVYELNGNEITHSELVPRKLEDLGIKAYYTDDKKIEHELNDDGQYTVDNANNPPPGLNMSGGDGNNALGTFHRYTYEGSPHDKATEDPYTEDGWTITKNDDGTFNVERKGTKDYLPNFIRETQDSERQFTQTVDGVTYTIRNEFGTEYKIAATFEAYSSKDKNYYTYNQSNHSLHHLITEEEAMQHNQNYETAQKLLNIVNGTGSGEEQNITVEEMLGFYEALLAQFKPYDSSADYKTKLNQARMNYLDTIDVPGLENPDENSVIFNFIDSNGNKAYLYVPVEYANSNGQVDSTFAYMYETSYLEGQNETISQKANIIYDEDGRIAKITFADGTVVIPEVTVEQDDAAYNAAMVKYDYQKDQYEKELADCNARTEIIAQQDKRLEIKLKSIDTQHSAIETELEALKKVLENNVKSSFGTFSA